MERYGSIPMLFFFIAVSLGLLLRWQLINPFPFIQYTYLLHAHSHIMFLGWVFNALYFAFVYSFVRDKWNSRYRMIFILLQLLVVGMLISFPLQGYGFFSILFSTLHTIAAIIFIVRFLHDARNVSSKNQISCYAVKISLVLFLLSTVGPFVLGFITSSGLRHSQWYSFSVYYYLHFQYNGFFLLGILGLFFKFLEDRGVMYSASIARKGIFWTAIACVPAYFLSTLWAKPSLVFNVIGFVGGIIQLLALGMLFKSCRTCLVQIKEALKAGSLIPLLIVVSSILIKEMLQLISAFPSVAQLAYEFRNYVMAYLHFVLLGIISLFLLIWFIEYDFIKTMWRKICVSTFLLGLAGMEFMLVAAPTIMGAGVSAIFVQATVFLFSIFLWASIGGLTVASFFCKSKR